MYVYYTAAIKFYSVYARSTYIKFQKVKLPLHLKSYFQPFEISHPYEMVNYLHFKLK